MQIPLPLLSGKVVQVLLQYLYTGRCLFPRDDLNLGIELMAAADQFLLDPMKAQCEQILSQKIDEEVCARTPHVHACMHVVVHTCGCACMCSTVHSYIAYYAHACCLHALKAYNFHLIITSAFNCS